MALLLLLFSAFLLLLPGTLLLFTLRLLLLAGPFLGLAACLLLLTRPLFLLLPRALLLLADTFFLLLPFAFLCLATSFLLPGTLLLLPRALFLLLAHALLLTRGLLLLLLPAICFFCPRLVSADLFLLATGLFGALPGRFLLLLLFARLLHALAAGRLGRRLLSGLFLLATHAILLFTTIVLLPARCLPLALDRLLGLPPACLFRPLLAGRLCSGIFRLLRLCGTRGCRRIAIASAFLQSALPRSLRRSSPRRWSMLSLLRAFASGLNLSGGTRSLGGSLSPRFALPFRRLLLLSCQARRSLFLRGLSPARLRTRHRAR